MADILMTTMSEVFNLFLEVKTEMMLFSLAIVMHRILFTNRVKSEKNPKPKGVKKVQDEAEAAPTPGPQADPARTLSFIEAAYDRGEHRAVLHRWNMLRRSSSVPAFHLARIIESMQRLKIDRSCIVSQVKNHLKELASSCDATYLNYLLKSVAKSLDAELVAGLLTVMPTLAVQPDAYTYEILIHMHFMTRSFDEIVRLASEIGSRGLQPTGRTSLVLLKSALHAGDFTEVLRRFREVVAAAGDTPTASAMPQHVVAHVVDLALKHGSGEALLAEFAGTSQIHREVQRSIADKFSQPQDRSIPRGGRPGAYERPNDNLPDTGREGNKDVAVAVLAACARSGDVELAQQLNVQAEPNATARCTEEDAATRSATSGSAEGISAVLMRTVSADPKRLISLIRNMSSQGNLSEALKLFHALEAKGAELTNSTWNAMLDACVERDELKKAEGLMGRMQASGLQDAVSYNTLIKAFLRREQYDRVRSLMDQMRKAGFAPNGVTYNELIHAMARSEDPHRRSTIWKVVEEMRNAGVEPNRITYSILLKNLGPRTPHSEVSAMMRLMDNLREPMDEVLSCSIIEACVRVGKPHLVTQKLTLLHGKGDMPTTTSHTFGSLIKAYGFTKDIKGAWRCWKEMRSQHVRPTSITIGCMTEAVVSNGDVDGGHELIQELLNDENTRGQVNSVIYGSVLKGYGRTGRSQRMWEVFSEMLSVGIKPSQSTYNVLIDACARNSMMCKVPELMDGMREHGFEPNLITYSTVIKGFCQQGDMQAALRTLEELRKRPRVKADEIVYNTLIDGCAQDGLMEPGEKLLEEMEAEGIVPSNYTLTSMVKLMGVAKRPDRALSIVETISKRYNLPADAYVSNALMRAFLQSREFRQAVKVLEQMVRDKLQPEPRSCQSIMTHLIGNGNLIQAISILRSLIDMPALMRGNSDRNQGVAIALLNDEAFLYRVLVSLQQGGLEGQSLAKVLLKDIHAKRPNFEFHLGTSEKPNYSNHW